MHEYSIVQALIARVEEEAHARHATGVHRLSVSVGELSGVDVELLVAAYDAFRDRTICAAASLDVRRISARWECPSCKHVIGRGEVLQCHRCRMPAALASGGDIMLDRIEMEVA